MAEIIIAGNVALSIFTSIILFFIAALAEIGGGYLVWKWLRERKGVVFGVAGGIVLFIYGIIPTLQPSNFGRVYAAYGGIFILRNHKNLTIMKTPNPAIKPELI